MSKVGSLKTGQGRNIVGKRVKVARRKAGLTQDQACGKLAKEGIVMDRSAFARIEAETRYVQDYELLALSKLLRVSVDWLLGRG